jgi:hypothetical protein
MYYFAGHGILISYWLAAHRPVDFSTRSPRIRNVACARIENRRHFESTANHGGILMFLVLLKRTGANILKISGGRKS